MLASHKGEIPFVVYIIPFLAGIALALSFNLAAYQPLLLLLFGVLLVAFAGLNIFYNKVNLHRRRWLGGILIHGLLLLTGIICPINYDARNHADYFEKQTGEYLLVKISNEPQFKDKFQRFTAEVEVAGNKLHKREASGTLLLVLPTDSAHAAKITYGDELLIPAKYNPVDPPFNPAEFNYKQYLAHQNIYAQAFLDPHQVVVMDRDNGNPIIAYSLQLRQRLVARFKQYMHSAEAIAVASTLILGYKAELDNEVLQAYSKTGTIHVLSVSGAHVAIVFWIINLLLGFLDRYRYGRLFKAFISITLIWYYSLLTGLSPAVCRAAVMISMIIIGKTYNRRINTLNILAISAFAILMANPLLLTDVGFQLSYLAVAGLIVFQPLVYHWFDIQNKWLDKLWLLCSVSIAAQVITFPLSAYYFHQFPVYFLLSNLFVAGLVAVVMGAGIACLFFAQIGCTVVAKAAGCVLEQSILLMDKGLRLVEHSPYASIGKIWITRGEYLLLFMLVILAFCIMYYKKPILLKAALACVLILSISVSVKKINAMRTDGIIFFNLKKHSSILFKQGSRGVLLTDLADTDKNYRYTIQPCLDSSRIRQLCILPFKKDTALNTYFIKKRNLVRFLHTDVLIIDKEMPNRPMAPKLYTDYLFITGNPHSNVQEIDNCFNYKTLILDAANTDRVINAFKGSTSNNDKKIYTLKRNKALIYVSKE